MGCLEGSGVPVLYIGRTVPKGEWLSLAMMISLNLHVMVEPKRSLLEFDK
jgi:hypothetical protein